MANNIDIDNLLYEFINFIYLFQCPNICSSSQETLNNLHKILIMLNTM